MKTSIVSHSHWDREWYKPFQYFNVRLNYFFNRLFTILEEDPAYKFMLDGQMVMIEDYLRLNPDKESIFKKFVKKQQLIIGPFYSQPDEFYPDGESLIRNLLLGTQMAKQFGDFMKIGYLPDAFGHSSQMPHILKQSGIDYACVMRGVPVDALNQNVFDWQSLGEDKVLTIALFNGYSNGMFLPDDEKDFYIRIKKEVRDFQKRFNQDHMLLMDGVDHQFPKRFTQKLASDIQDKDLNVEQTTLKSYISSIKHLERDMISGELITPVTHRVHASMASTRMKQKQANRYAQQLLERKVEPISVIGWLNGLSYPKTLINNAWKLLMKNQIHDSICGCCTDEVHREIDQRYQEINQICDALIKGQSRAISYKVADGKQKLLIFNDSFVKGKQYIQAEVLSDNHEFELYDQKQHKIKYSIDRIEDVDAASLSIWSLYLAKPYMIKKYIINFTIDFDFNYGYKVIDIVASQVEHMDMEVESDKNYIENKHYHISFNTDGTFDVYDKKTCVTYHRCQEIEDVADEGDTYNFSPIKDETFIVDDISNYQIKIKKDLDQYIAYVSYDFMVPKRLLKIQKRSKVMIKQHMAYQVKLFSDNDLIDVKVKVDNHALDHRMRLCFPTNLETNYSYAQSQFGTIKRPVSITSDPSWTEEMLPIYAQQKFVSVHDEHQGITILNENLTEYEVYQNPQKIAITLFRGVGYLGKADLNVRKGRPSGIPVETPDAQSLGSHEAHYALVIHKNHFDEAMITKKAELMSHMPHVCQSFVPMSDMMKRYKDFFKFYHIDSLQSVLYESLNEMDKGDFHFVDINHPYVFISAIKKSEVDDAFILRLYNPTKNEINDTHIYIGNPMKYVEQVNLIEEKICDLSVSDEQQIIVKQLKPYQTYSIKIYLKVRKSYD